MSHQMEIVSKVDPQSSAAGLVPLPSPRTPIAIRPGTLADLAFIDELQSKHTKMVGWMPEKALVGKIKLGHGWWGRSSSDTFSLQRKETKRRRDRETK
jgi:hypothetical protein